MRLLWLLFLDVLNFFLGLLALFLGCGLVGLLGGRLWWCLFLLFLLFLLFIFAFLLIFLLFLVPFLCFLHLLVFPFLIVRFLDLGKLFLRVGFGLADGIHNFESLLGQTDSNLHSVLEVDDLFLIVLNFISSLAELLSISQQGLLHIKDFTPHGLEVLLISLRLGEQALLLPLKALLVGLLHLFLGLLFFLSVLGVQLSQGLLEFVPLALACLHHFHFLLFQLQLVFRLQDFNFFSLAFLSELLLLLNSGLKCLSPGSSLFSLLLQDGGPLLLLAGLLLFDFLLELFLLLDEHLLLGLKFVDLVVVFLNHLRQDLHLLFVGLAGLFLFGLLVLGFLALGLLGLL